jgi:tryptophan synthase alpha chain
VTPIGLLVYANLVVARGMDLFYRQCQDAGVDSVLVADAPLHEYQPFLEAAGRHGIEPVLLCPPTATADRIAAIARTARGYTYLLSRAGVTGTATEAGKPVKETLALLREHGAPPPMIGFGISRPEHVERALSDGARGVICGSAIIERIARHLHDPQQMIADVGEFIMQLKRATVIN